MQHEDNTLSEFIESVGIIAQNDGLTRIAGRMLALILTEGDAISFSDLAVRLQVSRGSISTNGKMLENLGAIERISKPGERQDYFRPSRQPFANMIRARCAREQQAHDMIADLRDELPGEMNQAKAGMQTLLDYYKLSIDGAKYQLQSIGN